MAILELKKEPLLEKKLSPQLLGLLSIPAALWVASGCVNKSKNNAAPTPVATETPVPAAPNACVANAETKNSGSVCKEEDIQAKQERDIASCYFESCALPASGTCDYGFEPGVVSTPPTRAICRINNPVEL